MITNTEISEVFTIDTDENRCALLFCLQLQHDLNNAKMVFMTANSFELVHENIERVKPYISYADALIAKTKYLFLKDSWRNLENLYGTRALSNELSTLVEFSEHEIFFLHRIDLFFDKMFNKELEDVLIGFIKDIRYHHKKVIFSYNSKTATGKVFEEIFKQRRDISYHIEEDKSDVGGDCYTTIKTYNQFLKKSHSEILLLSDNQEMIDFHNTVFSEHKNIGFSHCTLADIVSGKEQVSETTDIIIYNDSTVELDEDMIKYLKSKAYFTKVYFLSHKQFLRKGDVSHLKQIGVDYMTPRFFDIKEYIGSIENVIENHFYSDTLKSIGFTAMPKEVDSDELSRRIALLGEQNIIFSILSIPVDVIGDRSMSLLIRDDDFVYHDDKKNEVVFVLLNILQKPAVEILSSRLKIDEKHIRPLSDSVR